MTPTEALKSAQEALRKAKTCGLSTEVRWVVSDALRQIEEALASPDEEATRANANAQKLFAEMARTEQLTNERDAYRTALEVIALGDCADPVRGAAETLVDLGHWRREAVEALPSNTLGDAFGPGSTLPSVAAIPIAHGDGLSVEAAADSGWTCVNDRLPPAAMSVLAFGIPYGTKHYALRHHRVMVTYINTRPRECVEDEEITHWRHLPPPPAQGMEARSAEPLAARPEGQQPGPKDAPKEDRGDAEDAERWRWARNHPWWLGYESDYRPEEVDRAIDTARKTA